MHRTVCSVRCRTFHALCVCLLDTLVSPASGWTDRDAFLWQSSADPRNHILVPSGEYGWSIRARRRCCLTSNYCDYSLSRCYDLSIWLRGGWAELADAVWAYRMRRTALTAAYSAVASELWGPGVHCSPKFRTCTLCTSQVNMRLMSKF